MVTLNLTTVHPIQVASVNAEVSVCAASIGSKWLSLGLQYFYGYGDKPQHHGFVAVLANAQIITFLLALFAYIQIKSA